MSWVSKLDNKFTITCGDGNTYEFLWKNPRKGLEWHSASFDFPELPGTLVKKSEKRGRQFELEIYFNGEDHLDKSEAFEKSLGSKIPCTINHPYYGVITAHIVSLLFDNSFFNETKITGTALETIVEDAPKISVDPIDRITIDKLNLDSNMEEALIAPPIQQDVQTMSQQNAKQFNASVPIITLPEELQEYTNIFNNANTYIQTAIASPVLAMRATIAMITAPYKFTASVLDRLNVLQKTFNDLRQTIFGITGVSSKQIYQIHLGTVVSTMCQTAITPLANNYRNSTQVLQVVNILFNNYRQYLKDMDDLQSPNGGQVGAFIPSAQVIVDINNLVYETIANLYDIALGARKERTWILEKDTNLILLTHRFYGLDTNDNNMIEMKENNKIGLNEILQIRKGRKIIYYI